MYISTLYNSGSKMSYLNPGICFQMKQKELLNSRWLVHKTPDGVVMYKCKLCPFSTKHRKSIIYHRTTHMEVSKEDMLPCTLCPYKVTRLSLTNLYITWFNNRNPNDFFKMYNHQRRKIIQNYLLLAM